MGGASGVCRVDGPSAVSGSSAKDSREQLGSGDLMQSFSFLHCADVHLGAPCQGLAGLSPEVGERLRDAPAAAFTRLITSALEQRVDAVIVAGDLFDAADRNLRAQIHLRDQLVRLDQAGIPSFICAGNHDPLNGWLASVSYPESAHFFGAEVSAVPLVREGTVVATVYGVSYPKSEIKENLAERFPKDPEGPISIAILHTNVGDRPGHAPYAPCSLTDLQSRSFDYWALGHVHTRETLHTERPVIHYPGSPQGLHINETGARGATLVEVKENGSISLTPVWTDVVRWHRVRTPIEGMMSFDDVLGAFGEVAGSIAGEAPECLHVVRWTLAGGGPLHHELRHTDAAQDLEGLLRTEYAPSAKSGSVWLDRLDLATRPSRDLRALREQQDLLGDLLRLADELRSSPPAPPTREIGTAKLFGPEPEVSVAAREALVELLDDRRIRAALDSDPWRDLDWHSLVGCAENLAIEALAEDQDE